MQKLTLREGINLDLSQADWEPFESEWQRLRELKPKPSARQAVVMAAAVAGWFTQPLTADEVRALPARILVPASKLVYPILNAVLLSDPS